MCCTEGDRARDDVFANICSDANMVGMVHGLTFKGIGKGYSEFKSHTKHSLSGLTNRNLPQMRHWWWLWGLCVPSFQLLLTPHWTWHQFHFAGPLHCFLHGFQNTSVYPVLFVYTRIELIIYNENCTNGISAPFLFANCLWTNCRNLQWITQKYWQFFIE